jgi:hypothetical protein
MIQRPRQGISAARVQSRREFSASGVGGAGAITSRRPSLPRGAKGSRIESVGEKLSVQMYTTVQNDPSPTAVGEAR